MSEHQLSALLEAIKSDAVLQGELKGAADLDTAVAIAQEAGFDVGKEDWLRYQAGQSLELNDEELERVAGGEKDTEGREPQAILTVALVDANKRSRQTQTPFPYKPLRQQGLFCSSTKTRSPKTMVSPATMGMISKEIGPA